MMINLHKFCTSCSWRNNWQHQLRLSSLYPWLITTSALR